MIVDVLRRLQQAFRILKDVSVGQAEPYLENRGAVCFVRDLSVNACTPTSNTNSTLKPVQNHSVHNQSITTLWASEFER